MKTPQFCRIGSILFASFLMLSSGILLAGDGSIDPNTGEMNFQFNFRFPPISSQIQDVKDAIQGASELICDATDGQVLFGTVRLTEGAVDEDRGDIWFHPQQGRSAVNFYFDGSNLRRLGKHINLYQGGRFADIIAHELGHHAFGLGDEYNEQRRFGGPCGIGPSFDTGTVDEVNHSIMQQSGKVRCSVTDQRCLRDGDCPGGETCIPILMSEMSVASNHDLLLGDSMLCPAPVAATLLEVDASLDPTAPIVPFDATSFSTAESTAALRGSVEVIDSLGGIPAHSLELYFERLAPSSWRLHFGIDDGDVGGTAGDLNILDTVDLAFNANGSLNALTPASPALAITGLTNGAANINLTLDLGTPNPDPIANPGDGFDGVVEGAGTMEFTLKRSNGFPLCTDADCADRWNSVTGRYEVTQQTLIHPGLSDWETVNQNYSFVSVPAGLPSQAAPGACATPVNFIEDVVGTDQVMLFIDRSGSMDAPVSDGSTSSRLDFAKAAARAFVDLQAGRGAQVGLISFEETPTLHRGLVDLNAGDATGVKNTIDLMTAGGATGIGTALTAATFEFQSAATGSRTRTAFLLSDGQNNRGEDPDVAAQRLQDEGVRIFTVPVGSAADRDLLSDMAGESGGTMFDAPSGDELPPIYAELFARFRGETLALPRTASAVAQEIIISGDGARKQKFTEEGSKNKKKGKKWRQRRQRARRLRQSQAAIASLPPSEIFPFYVEPGAERLNVMISARNLDVTTWGPAFRLTGPGGELITETDPNVATDPYYRLLDVMGPTPGEWNLEIIAPSTVEQHSYLLAHVENPLPDCLVDALSRIATAAQPVSIAAQLSYGADLDGAIAFTGIVRRPDGSLSPLAFDYDPQARTHTADFSAFNGRGIYDITVLCLALDGAGILPGEIIFDGPEDPNIDLEPFVRLARTSFFLDDPALPPCATTDCDNDGIPNGVEGTDDLDMDGLPNDRDDDADGDDWPDAVEGTVDTDGDGTPDFLDLDSDDDGIPDIDDPQRTTPNAVCGDGILGPGEECDDGNTDDGDGCSSTCEIENTPPDCSAAAPSRDLLWSPNHKYRSIGILGVTDVDADPIAITIDSIFQDEELNGLGDGNTCPDGRGVGTSAAMIRSERSGQGDGRIYHIGFTADDGEGGQCTGAVMVCVPHDRGDSVSCTDGGALYDSTGPCESPENGKKNGKSNKAKKGNGKKGKNGKK